jgi:cold shock CspA family protein
MKGVVKWWHEPKGFGFLVAEDGAEIFVHFSSIDHPGWQNLGNLCTSLRPALYLNKLEA